MSTNNVIKRENTSSSANVLMCKQWWKVCWMYGDQEKYYRQLYAKQRQTAIENNKYENVPISGTNQAVISSTTFDRHYENTQIEKKRERKCVNNQCSSRNSDSAQGKTMDNTSSSSSFNNSDNSGLYNGVEWGNKIDE